MISQLEERRRAAGPPISARLVHVPGYDVTDLADRPIVLGRGPDGVDVCLPGARVSRRHARLEPVPGGTHRLLDLGSTNGTLVNGHRVTSVLLEPLDRVQVGEHVLVYLEPTTSAQRVVELMTPTETSHLGGRKSPLAERLLGLTLLVQERSGDPELIVTLDAVLEELHSLTGHARGLFLVEHDELGAPALRPIHQRGVAQGGLTAEVLEALRPAVREALDAGHVTWSTTPLGEHTVCVPLESRRATGLPERRRGHPTSARGALLLAGRAGRWQPSPEEEGLLRALTRQVAAVLSSARLERQVTTDPLTDLPNRAYLERLLAEELAHLRTTGDPVAVILVDIDDFKRVNDTRGHAIGDQVLRHVSDRLRWALRHTDSAGRWGGEEFLVVLPGADLIGAAVVAEKIVQVVGSSPAGETGVYVTVSAGVAAAPAHGLESRELVECADRALYAAKREGKNQRRAYDSTLVGAADQGDQTLCLVAPLGRADADAGIAPVAWLHGDAFSFPLRPGVRSVGRSPACDVVLPDREVSRQHALLQVSPTGDRVVLDDCSRNGSVVNGAPVVDAVELRTGDQVQIGPYTLRLEARATALEQTSAGAMLGGRLEDTCLCALLLRLESMRTTGPLTVRAAGLIGEVLLRGGQPVSASAGDARGLEAVARLLPLAGGAYVFCHAPVDQPRGIPLTTTGMLLAACAADESGVRVCPRGAACLLETARTQRPQLDC